LPFYHQTPKPAAGKKEVTPSKSKQAKKKSTPSKGLYFSQFDSYNIYSGGPEGSEGTTEAASTETVTY